MTSSLRLEYFNSGVGKDFEAVVGAALKEPVARAVVAEGPLGSAASFISDSQRTLYDWHCVKQAIVHPCRHQWRCQTHGNCHKMQ